MMARRVLFGAIAVLTIATAAADHARPHIVHASVEGSYVTLEFNEPMLTWSGTSTPPTVHLEPPLRCDWSWSNDTLFHCMTPYGSPEPPAATRYTVRIDGGLWSQQMQEIEPTTQVIETTRPTAQNASVEQWKDGVPVISLSTNADVTAEALRAVLRVESDGAPHDATLKVAPDPFARGHQRQWMIEPTPSVTPDRVLSVRLDAGLVSTEGPLRGEESPVLLRARMAESFRARRAGCDTDWQQQPKPREPRALDAGPVRIDCPTGHGTYIELSQELSAASLAQLRTSLPDGWHVEVSKAQPYGVITREGQISEESGHTLWFVAARPNQETDLILTQSLTSALGQSLQREARIHLHSGDYLPDVRGIATQRLLPPDASMPTLFSSVNIPELVFTQTTLGGDQPVTAKSTVENGGSNAIAMLQPPAPARDIVRDGGLVQGTLSGGNNHSGSYSLNIAAFNVTAVHAGTEYLIWVTDWNGAKPLAGAKVELLASTPPHTVTSRASSMTDADGLAVLDDANADTQRTSDRLIRVSRGGQRAILSLASLITAKRDRPWSPERTIAEGETAVWGVSDRPLYRPGETVHYRVWVRRREENRLRAADQRDIKLALRSMWSPGAVIEIPATLDAFGSAAGELILPSSLRDSDYCIDRAGSHDREGACFRVTGYHVNDMWAEAKVDHKFARDGDTIGLEGSAGYYSGGPATGAEASFSSLLTPLPFTDAYPAYAGFVFIDPYDHTRGSGGEQLSGIDNTRLLTDASGLVRRSVRLSNPPQMYSDEQQPIPFGKLEITFGASNSGSQYATSAPAELTYSRYARFVGIKIEPWMLRTDTDPVIDSVVVSDSGERLPEASVHIVIEDPTQKGEGNKPKVIATCEVHTGKAAPCPFRPPHAGLYRFRASSEGAADATLTRYAFGDTIHIADDDEERTKLFTQDKHGAAGDSAHLILQQPFTHANVLFTIEHGRVLKHWTTRVDAPMTKFDVPIPAAWSPGVSVKAIVLDATSAAFGPRASKHNLADAASIDLDITGAPKPTPVVIDVDHAKTQPGAEIALTMRNPSNRRVQVTLALVDDSARALVPEETAKADPSGPDWLGSLAHWEDSRVAALGIWPRIDAAPHAQDQFIANPYGYNGGLESIVVTGSNIMAADIFPRGAAKFAVADIETANPVIVINRGALRSRFVESAYWKTDLVLDANGSHTEPVKLPDNLTRWRVLAWSADADDGFALAQATVEASLPIEVRADVPVRLFPGDTSDVRASVRNHDADAHDVTATLHAQGVGVDAKAQWQKNIASNAQQRIDVTAQPNGVGEIRVDVRAKGAGSADGVAASIDVDSPHVHQRLPVAGWLSPDGVRLAVPALPQGAAQPHLIIRISRGLGALAQAWSDALRDYPHRCWEQILSRAVGAAAAKKLGVDSGWHDADAVIDEALRSAAQFQDSSGYFHFFAMHDGDFVGQPNDYLTAYTVRAFGFLAALGYEIPAEVDSKARDALARALAPVRQGFPSRERPLRDTDAAASLASGVAATVDGDVWDGLWERRASLPWSSRADLALAMSNLPRLETRTRQIVDELRDAGTRHGLARVIRGDNNLRFAFASSVLDQCAVIRALDVLDHSPDARDVRAAYLRGLNDLYGGGGGSRDTQASATCLSMLAQSQAASGADAITVAVSADDATDTIHLGVREQDAEWRAPSMPKHVTLHATSPSDELVSFVANVDYDLDGRHAERAAVGFAIDRQYSVLRNHEWVPVDHAGIREGDWVRVALHFTTAAPRHLVAISDSVPGGLRPTDPELSGVSDLDIKRLSSVGSGYFYEHQIDDRFARFYAEDVPPGSQDIYYYARAAHRGHYSALPATAELMYGETSMARTPSGAIEIADNNQPAARKASAIGAK